MGHIYTDTMPLPFKRPKHHFEDFAILFPPLTPVAVADPIRRELQRRLDGCRERRRAAALSPGNDEDFAAWNREVARGRKLSLILIRHLSRPL